MTRKNRYLPNERQSNKAVEVGSVKIGNEAPVAVQSMTNTKTTDVQTTLKQIRILQSEGADLVRVAIPDFDSLDSFGRLCDFSPIPLIADIHFDYRLALGAIAGGASKIRINPGNIEKKKHIQEIVAAAADASIPIRVGVNSGSLPKDLHERYGPTAQAMVEACLRHVSLLESLGFQDLILSLKSSNVAETVRANEMIVECVNYPIHLGITEAGRRWRGSIKSAVGLGYLLAQGIGDTFRVSLTGDPIYEVRAAWEILKAWDLRTRGISIISCPTCGRCQVNLPNIAVKVEEQLQDIIVPMTVAIMGCEVNGPGEAKEADVGLACGQSAGLLMQDGEVISKVSEDEMIEELTALVRNHAADLKVENSKPNTDDPEN